MKLYHGKIWEGEGSHFVEAVGLSLSRLLDVVSHLIASWGGYVIMPTLALVAE